LRHAIDDLYGESASLLNLVTGRATTGDDLRAAAARITNLKKLFNIRQGWTRADDTLPPRVLDGDGPLTTSWLNEMIDAYYQVRGWDHEGRISPAQLDRIGLAELVAGGSSPQGSMG
jgi:aldehyde:ferredoxin oxidoreductase